MRILLVEDDRELAYTIKDYFSNKYIVDTVHNGNDGIYYAQVTPYELIIIDLGLPDFSGKEVCRMARASNIKTPILILTGKTSITSKIESFDIGADDYLTKPFSFKELEYRIKALIRRNTFYKNIPKEKGAIVLLVEEAVVEIGHKKIKLREKEFELLDLLFRNCGKIISKERILSSVWENQEDLNSNTVEVHISRLRKSIKNKGNPIKIKTIPKRGYRLEL